MKLTTLAIGLLCCFSSALALSADPINVSSSGSVIGDDVLYNIGGERRDNGERRQHGQYFRRRWLEQQPGLRKHEHEQHPAEPVEWCHFWIPKHHELGGAERHQRRRLAASLDPPTCKPSAIQPHHEWHLAGSIGL